MHIIGVPGEESGVNQAETLFGKVISWEFPNLMKDIKPRFKELDECLQTTPDTS